MRKATRLLNLPAPILLLLSITYAQQFPYNPTRIFRSPQDDKLLYILQPEPSGSQHSLSALDLSTTVTASNINLSPIFSTLPFLSDTTSVPVSATMDTSGNITIFTGSCTGPGQMYRYSTAGSKSREGSWVQQNETASSGTSGSPQFLSSAIAFSSKVSATFTSMKYYFFAGMCPKSSSTTSTWQTNANYTNNMLSFSPSTSAGSLSYSSSLITAKNLPISEAGQSVTALQPTYSNRSDGSSTQQQDFVILGGNVAGAFINMSQVALWSLPQAAWTYFAVSSSNLNSHAELAVRDTIPDIEPRSGHTAVLTADGTKIVVFGGWVTNVSTPASPQLAVLEVSESYGGAGDWTWTAPSIASSNGPATGGGIYGHGAVMLSGDVMLISGGYTIAASTPSRKRQAGSAVNNKSYLFNVSSNTWLTSYDAAAASSSDAASPSSSGLLSKTSQQAGLGIGVGLGAVAVAALLYFYLWYRRRNKRAERERTSNEMAESSAADDWAMRSASAEYYRASDTEPNDHKNGNHRHSIKLPPSREGWSSGGSLVERTGLLIPNPSPTRGLRRSASGRGAHTSQKRQNQNMDVIEERRNSESSFRSTHAETGKLQDRNLQPLQTRSHLGALNNEANPLRSHPMPVEINDETPQSAHDRRTEVQGWVQDWEKATGALLGRVDLAGDGRDSPSSSDHTHTMSSLSDSSTYSSSTTNPYAGGVSGLARQLSTSSAAFLNGFAASIGAGGVAGGLERSSSDARTSLPSQIRRRRDSLTGTGAAFSPTQTQNDTTALLQNPARFTVAATPMSQIQAQGDYLLGSANQFRGQSMPPSPGKEKKSMGWYGSVKRVISGTPRGTTMPAIPPPQQYYDRSGPSSPTKSAGDDSARPVPQRTASDASFMRSKRGQRDWTIEGDQPEQTEHLQRPSAPDGAEDFGDEWDVERAAEGRVVQLMFTVPKQRLRVVNMDDEDFDGRSVQSKNSLGSIRGGKAYRANW